MLSSVYGILRNLGYTKQYLVEISSIDHVGKMFLDFWNRRLQAPLVPPFIKLILTRERDYVNFLNIFAIDRYATLSQARTHRSIFGRDCSCQDQNALDERAAPDV